MRPAHPSQCLLRFLTFGKLLVFVPRVANNAAFLLLLCEVIPLDAFVVGLEPGPPLADTGARGKQLGHVVGNGGHPSRAGLTLNRDVKAGIAQLLRQPSVEFGVEAEIEAGARSPPFLR